MSQRAIRRLLRGGATAAALAIAGLAAPGAATAQEPMAQEPMEMQDFDDDGGNWGWVGLLGLAGLLGLRRRDREVSRPVDTTTRRP